MVTLPAKVYRGVPPPPLLANVMVDPAVVLVRLKKVVEADPPIAVVPALVRSRVWEPDAVKVPLLVKVPPESVYVPDVGESVPDTSKV